MKKHLSNTDLSIIAITIILFVVALFVKGLTKDLLLEAGVLLVSIKLILMNYKSNMQNKKILEELVDIKKSLAEKEKEKNN